MNSSQFAGQELGGPVPPNDQSAGPLSVMVTMRSGAWTPHRPLVATPPAASVDPVLGAALWRQSEELTGVTFAARPPWSTTDWRMP
jgi:hypothetical protein